MEVGHLAPHEEAERVGPVQPSWVLHFLVFARAIEAHSLGDLDVTPQLRVGGRGQQPAREVALVED